MRYFFRYFKPTFLFLFLILPLTLNAQFYKEIFKQDDQKSGIFSAKQQESLIKLLRNDVKYLSSAKLEGRRTGSYGEQLAGMFIQSRMEDIGLKAYKNSFRHNFKYETNKVISKDCRFTIDRKFIFIPEEAFPTPYSASGSDQNFVLPNSTENYAPWFIPLYHSETEADNPNFDWQEQTYKRAKQAENRGATSIVFYDSYGSKYAPKLTTHAIFKPLSIPVVIMLKKAYDENLKDMVVMKPFALTIKYKSNYDEGNNVIGYINNDAALSVIIGAHYDHLGHGEDLGIHNGATVYNGANDNASGVAVMLALAKQLKSSDLKKYNFIFIAFSGAEQNLAGSKAFIEAKGFKRREIAYMINLDQVGIPDLSYNLFVGGVASFASLTPFLSSIPTKFKIVKEPISKLKQSDHIPFYNDSIPTLFFTTGNYTDYHKPTDDYYKINYPSTLNVVEYVYQFIAKMNKQPIPLFATINPYQINASPAISTVITQNPFGISQEEKYQGIGVEIGQIVKGSAAYNAKLNIGDIILQIEGIKINSFQDYTKTILGLKKGDKVTLTVKRGPTIQKFALIY